MEWLKFPLRVSPSPGPGHFKSPKKQVALGVTSIQRAILGPNPTRANWPDCNRYVEATIEKLVAAYPSDRRSKKTKTSTTRWNLMKNAYSCIQGLIMSNRRVMTETDIQLSSVNIKTIQQWYNKKGKEKDLQVVLQGIDLPQPSISWTGAPQPKDKPATFSVGQGESFSFPDPQDTAGMAKLKRPRLQQATTSSPTFSPCRASHSPPRETTTST
ncbi:uncharacterized protein LOC135463897 [Liolophura sinensis]|uniref:uncharacterized protein LOC135463897 n=1 Tax=Liolophura sinensis TaxID=3198878 RepID=UPI0031586709